MKGLKYNLALILANVLFALNYSVFVSILERDMLSIGAIYMLQNVGLLCLAVLLRISLRARSPMRIIDIVIISSISLLSSAGWSYAMLQGMSITSPVDAATIASAGPSLTLIYAHFMGRRQLTGVRIIGICLSLAGVILLIISRGVGLAMGSGAKGNALLFGAVCVAAINTLLFKPQLERYGLRRVLFIYATATFACSFPFFAHNLSSLSTAHHNATTLFELTILILAGSALPLMLLLEGTEFLSPLHTSLYRYLQPITTATIVALRSQSHHLTLENGIAIAAIILGGVAVAKGVDKAG